VVSCGDAAVSHGRVNGIFDLLVPGGGLGEFDGCASVFPHAASVPQSRFGGMHSPADCDRAFAEHQPAIAGCHWLFRGGLFAYPARGVSFAGDGQVVHASREACPGALNRRSGCALGDGAADVVGWQTVGG